MQIKFVPCSRWGESYEEQVIQVLWGGFLSENTIGIADAAQ